jgi:hypothetical protein
MRNGVVPKEVAAIGADAHDALPHHQYNLLLAFDIDQDG